MGRGKHCSPEKRKLIFQLYEVNKSPTEIAQMLKCSRNMVYNAIRLSATDKKYLTENKERKPKSRKTTILIDRTIVRKSKLDPFKSSRQINKEIKEEFDVVLSNRSVRRRLNEANLFGRISRKKPLLSKKNIKKRLHFAKNHKRDDLTFWKKILWSDETKVNRIGPDGRTIVHRPKNQALNIKYTQKTVKHGGGSLMVWGAFSWYGIGPIVKIEGKMDRFQYLDILKKAMDPFAFENMPITWTFMHDNDPKHSSTIIKEWFSEENIRVLDWPAQSPDLNPIENLWNDVKNKIAQQNFKNSEELWVGVQEAWYSIPISRCQRLVESMPRRCQAVINNKGFSTKY